MQLTGITLALLLGAASASSSVSVNFPPDFTPEDIAFVQDTTAFVSSSTDGAIWKGDMKTGEGDVVVPASGGMALGIDYDERTGFLYVPGGNTGTFRVYDGDYNLVLENVMDPGAILTFVNTAVVGKDYVYVTDSLRSQFYALPLGEDAMPVDGADTVAEIVRIGGDGFPPDAEVYVNQTESFKSVAAVPPDRETPTNGTRCRRALRVACVCGVRDYRRRQLSDDESMMIVSVLGTYEQYRVETVTGEAKRIDINVGLIPADGLARRGNTLWLVESGLSSGYEAIHEVMLSDDWTCGEVMRVFQDQMLYTPIRATLKDNIIVIVNFFLLNTGDDDAVATYQFTAIDKDEATTVNCSELSGLYLRHERPSLGLAGAGLSLL